MNTFFGLKNTVLAIVGGFALTATAWAQLNLASGAELAQEAIAGAVTLPSGKSDALLMSTCGGCPPKTFRITPSTLYFLGERPTDLAELRAAVAAHPKSILTISYAVKTGEVKRISSDIDFRSRK